jgi:hypothetical protein
MIDCMTLSDQYYYKQLIIAPNVQEKILLNERKVLHDFFKPHHYHSLLVASPQIISFFKCLKTSSSTFLKKKIEWKWNIFWILFQNEILIIW